MKEIKKLMRISIYEQAVWIDNYTVIDCVWMLLKNYHDNNGSFKAEWLCNEEDADIVGFSCYSWNEEFMLKTAKHIKEKNPNTLIVFGGPQPDVSRGYLLTHQFIDAIVPADGEQPFNDIIEGKPLNNIDGVITKTSMNMVRPMFKEWPGSAVLDNQEYIHNTSHDINNTGMSTYIYESTRGCPYQCVYCDWGGGTYTKLRRKPIELVKEELEALAKANIHLLRFQDGNFGILKRDVEIAEFLTELKAKYGYPKLIHVNWAKNAKERVRDIMRIFYKATMIHFYKISLQDLDGDVGKAIKRKDVPWDEQLRIGYQLKEELGMPIKIEIILGLPGQTKENFFNEYCQMMDAGVEVPIPYLCQVLPNTELATDKYQKEWGVKTALIKHGQYPFIQYVKNISNMMSICIGTNIISTEDWLDMLIYANLLVAVENGGILDGYVKNKYDYVKIWYEFFNNPEFSFTFNMLNTVRNHVNKYLAMPTQALTNLSPINGDTDILMALDCFFHASIMLNKEFAEEFKQYSGYNIPVTEIKDIKSTYENGLITITNKDYNASIAEMA